MHGLCTHCPECLWAGIMHGRAAGAQATRIPQYLVYVMPCRSAIAILLALPIRNSPSTSFQHTRS